MRYQRIRLDIQLGTSQHFTVAEVLLAGEGMGLEQKSWSRVAAVPSPCPKTAWMGFAESITDSQP